MTRNSRSPTNPTSLFHQPPHSTGSTTQPTPLLLPTPLKQSLISFKRLSPKELAMRRKKGLCFNCDEKYHRGHKCAFKFFLLIAEEYDNTPADHVFLDPPPDKSYPSP